MYTDVYRCIQMYTDVYRCMQSMLYKLYNIYNVLLVSCRCQNCQTVSRSHQNYLTILWYFSSATRLKHSLWNRTMTDIEEAWYGLMGVADTVYHGVSWCIMMYRALRTCHAMRSICSSQQGIGTKETDGDGWRPEACGQSQRCQHSTQHSIAYCWLHYTVSELSLSDTWSPWLRSSAAFGQRWIPCGNIDCFASSFSGHKIWRNGLFSSLLYTHLGTTPW